MSETFQTLFRRGDDGCHTFRIPSIIALPSGRVLVFCEARRGSAGDSGAIDIVQRASDDGCESFSLMRTVASSGRDTAGNPCPIYDRETRRLFLLYNTNDADKPESMILRGQGPRDVWVIFSDDEGETWSAPRCITGEVKKPDWTWYALGPCHGVCLKRGRLLVGANHAVLNPSAGRSGCYISHTVYSDDHGATWHAGPDLEDESNECALTAFADDSVLVNARHIPFASPNSDRACRMQALSPDGGDTFAPLAFMPELTDPCCQGSLLTVHTPRGEEVLFSNAASRTRDHLTVKRSRDRGASWHTERLITPGPSAYSDLTQLPDGSIALVCEQGIESPYEQIALHRFRLTP